MGKAANMYFMTRKGQCFYVETSIITQKQTVLTHLAWVRPQICTFWHEKACVLCRNINYYAKTNYPHSFGMGKAANMYFMTWKGRRFMQKHKSFRKNKLSSFIWHGKGRKYVLHDTKRPVFLCRNINHSAKTNCPHSFSMGKAANMYFLTWKGRSFMQKHQSLRKNKLKALKVESSLEEFLHEAFHLLCVWIEFRPCLYKLLFL